MPWHYPEVASFKNTFLPNRSHACSEKAVLVRLAVVGDTIIE